MRCFLALLVAFLFTISVGAAPAARLEARPEVVALTRLARQAQDAYKFDDALRFYHEALAQARALRDKVGESITLNNIGIVYWKTGQPQQALASYNQALPILRAVGDKRTEAATLNNMGEVYSNIGQPQQALKFFSQALPILRAIGEKGGEAATLNNIGGVYVNIGQPQQALASYSQVLPLCRAVGNKGGEAITLNNIGSVYASIGQPQQALAFFNQALPLRHAVGDQNGEATTLNNIGGVYSDIGQPQQALAFYNLALPVLRAVGDKRGEATTLGNIGRVYSDIGQSQQALSFYNQALLLRHDTGAKGDEAGTLTSIGLVYSGIGQQQQALKFFNQALPILREVSDKGGEASTISNIGGAYASMGQREQALAFFNQALPILRAVGNKGGEAATLNNIGEVYFGMGQPQQALAFFNQALPILRAIGDKGGEAGTLSNIGGVQAAQGHLQEATTTQSAALDILEKMRTSLGSLSENKESFLASKLFQYHVYIDLLLRQNKVATAFAWAEKTKARALLDVMSSGKVDFNKDLTAQEQQRRQELQQQAARLNNQLVVAALHGDDGAVKVIKARLAQNESDLQTFSDTVYSRHPDLARQRAAKTVSPEDVARFLPSDTALLDYVTLDVQLSGGPQTVDKTVLFCVTNEGGQAKVTAYPIERKSAELSELAENFRQDCSDPNQNYRPKTEARDLYAMLIAPAVQQLRGKKHLIVCPDGPLWGLPFQALLSKDDRGDEQYLLQQYEITYAYSATAIQAAQQEKDDPQRRKPAGTLLAMANPDFGGADRFGSDAAPVAVAQDDPRAIRVGSRAIRVDARGLLTRDGAIHPLPATQDEADALHKDYPDAAIKTRNDAQESIAKQQAGTFRYLHFATHGLFNDAAPMLSSIVLAQPSPGSLEDGFLTAREIADLKLSADLVVLSACETGRGENRSGEGIVGLTWALFVAGAPSQVVSQWSVADESTATLMQKFYSHLKKGEAKGAALRAAELELMQDGQHAHPFYWAPFILVGDWR